MDTVEFLTDYMVNNKSRSELARQYGISRGEVGRLLAKHQSILGEMRNLVGDAINLRVGDRAGEIGNSALYLMEKALKVMSECLSVEEFPVLPVETRRLERRYHRVVNGERVLSSITEEVETIEGRRDSSAYRMRMEAASRVLKFLEGVGFRVKDRESSIGKDEITIVELE